MSSSSNAPSMSKQQLLAHVIDRTGTLTPLRWLHDLGRTPVLVLAYHRILDIPEPRAYPLDLGLISASVAEFDAQMRALREHANPVALDAVADTLARGAQMPPRAVAVTFDDGFPDTFGNAYPVLKRYRIPATIFVSTGQVESKTVYWFELVAHLMMRVPPRSLTLSEYPDGLPVDDSEPARREAIALVHRILKICSRMRRDAMIDDWRTRFGQYLDEHAMELSRPISRDQILQMASDGIDIGSHTVSHSNLALASTEIIERELADSRAHLEKMLGRPVRSLAYPFGTPDTFDARVMRLARQCGYEIAVTYRQGVNWLGQIEPFNLKRIGIGPGVTPAQFRAMLALPSWLHPNFDDSGH